MHITNLQVAIGISIITGLLVFVASSLLVWRMAEWKRLRQALRDLQESHKRFDKFLKKLEAWVYEHKPKS